jgi:hypothetical protein
MKRKLITRFINLELKWNGLIVNDHTTKEGSQNKAKNKFGILHHGVFLIL